jgi:heme/copper-type cytochrome/quinol oxidase subunit 1
MDLIRIVATIIVAIAEPVGLNASRRRVSSRAAPATDAMTNCLAAISFVFTVITVLIPIANLFVSLKIKKGKNVKEFLFFFESHLEMTSSFYEPMKEERKHSLVAVGRPRRWCSFDR